MSRSTSGRIYLDALSGQPLSPEALAAWNVAAAQTFSSPSARHSEAAISRQFLEAARATLSRLWNVPASAITPVFGLSNAFRLTLGAVDKTASIALNPISRRGLLSMISASGHRTTELAVDGIGAVDHSTDADVIFTQAGNHELGTLSALRHNNSALVVADATEWVGRVSHLPEADVIIARADAWGGIHDVCFVIDVQGKISIPERLRVVNAPDIPSLIASVSALENVDADIELVHREIIDAIRTALPEGFTSLGDSINRLPHILTITAPDIDGEALAHELDKRGYAVGSASACAVESATASHVLTSIGIPGNNNIRLSLPIHINNRDAFDTDAFVAALAQSADSLRR